MVSSASPFFASLLGVTIKCVGFLFDRDTVVPSPTPSPTDPVPAGPRTAGRLRTRHLARKIGNLDAQNTRGSHTAPSPPFSACDQLIPQNGGLGGRSSALLGF